MKERLKLIFIPLGISGIGIILILGSWLYGSYHKHIENTVSSAERVLFDAIQEYVQTQYNGSSENSGRPMKPTFFIEKQLFEELVKVYPNVSVDSLTDIMERLHEKILPLPFPDNPVSAEAPSGLPLRPRHLLPGFLFNQVTFDSTSYATLYDKIQKRLNDTSPKTNFKLDIMTVKDDGFLTSEGNIIRNSAIRVPVKSINGTVLTVRPLLIDRKQGQFISLTLFLPWQYSLYSLSWQLTISVFLVLTILGCFVYLFQIISRQDRLAELRKTFVNQMTHELRTPVSTVYAAVQGLQEYPKEETDKRDLLQQIAREELEHLSDMIDNVLQVAEDDDASKKQLKYTYINLEELLSKCIARAGIRTDTEEIKFITRNITKEHYLWADRLHLGNVIANLLDNAIKYGAKNIRITTQDVREGEFIEIVISDDGIGIPDSYHELIFDPFFRIPKDDGSYSRGFGLGLAYVKQIVRQHKGTIKLKSLNGRGSSFIIKIPKNKKYD